MTHTERTDPGDARDLYLDTRVEPPDQPLPVTSDGYPTSLDVHGRDVVDTGLTSDASVRGMGADLDAMPGDETPIRPAGGRFPVRDTATDMDTIPDTDVQDVMDIQTTEQDRTKMRLHTDTLPPGEPGIPGPRDDVDRDDSQTREASSEPIL